MSTPHVVIYVVQLCLWGQWPVASFVLADVDASWHSSMLELLQERRAQWPSRVLTAKSRFATARQSLGALPVGAANVVKQITIDSWKETAQI